MWSTVQRGLTEDAPPDGTLSLAFYHFANAERAAEQIKRLAKVRQPASLVRTADRSDAVIRTNSTTVITRHGSDIVVVDGSEARSSAREQASWVYRLLKVDSSDGSGLRCYLSVKDASRNPGGLVNNDGTAQVGYADLGTNTAALERLHSDRPFFEPSTLVATNDPTDRVVATPDHPEEVEAVHGPYVVTLNLTGVTPAARKNATWAYRVQRTALKFAGATVVPNAALPPDPVTPGPPPAPAAFAWHTSGHTSPTWAWLADPFAHVLVLMACHRFLLMPVLIFGGVFLGVVGTGTKSRPRARNGRRWSRQLGNRGDGC